jgi:hypothetical protein
MALASERTDSRIAQIAAPARPVWLLRYSPVAVLIAILIADSNRHTDPDLWGHLRFGQSFIADRYIPRHDIYSYTSAGFAWRDHEWLAEVIMAAIYNAAGVVGLKLWKFACTALTVFFIADTEAQTGAPPRIQLAILYVAAFGSVLQSQFRPQMFTFVLLGALLSLLTRENYRRAAPLWLAVPLMALWANLHGGFFIGIAALALFTGVATIVDAVSGAGWRRGARLCMLSISAAAATLLNPYGLGMWGAVAHALRNPYTRNVVTDWQPMLWAMVMRSRSAPSGVVLYLAVIALIAALGLSFAMATDGDDMPLMAVAAMMAMAALLSVRNMALAAIAASGPLARHLALLRLRYAPAAPSEPWRPAAQSAALAVALSMALRGGLLSSGLVPDRGYPAGALAFMRQHHLHGNVLAEFGWGDYLIWYGAPSNKVFIDGRYDTVYPFSLIREYLEFYFDQPDGVATLYAHRHDFVLVGAQAPASSLMERLDDWKLIYRDGTAVLFARRDAPAAALPGLPQTAAARYDGFP